MNLKKSISLLMATVFICLSIPMNIFADVVTSEERDIATYGVSDVITSDSSVQVEFNLIDKWDGGYNAEVKIKNTGDTTVENWSLKFDFDEEITNIWNANIKQHLDETYVIKNNEWNNNIAPNSEVIFGFSGTCEEELKEPCNYEIISIKRENDKEDYSIVFEVINDWIDGYSAQITITNNTPETMEGWHLEFNFDKPIDSMWNGIIEKQEGTRYYIVNSGYNANIRSGESVIIGFNGNEGNIENEPENYILEQYNESINNMVKIRINTELFEKNEFGELYYVENYIDTLTGTLKNANRVDSLEYSIKDYKGVIVKSGVIDVNENWKINDFGMVVGANFITITAITNENKEVSQEITVLNYSIDNMDNVEVDMNDDDEDGLPNYFETIYETSLQSEDTDEDGLSDLYEIILLGTDPNLSDTNGDGVTDADEDFDADGLTNLVEFNIGTHPLMADTDGDNLSDGDELNKYNTNPLKPDTDDDGLEDDVEFKLGFNPNKEDTDENGTLDRDEFIEQKYTYEIINSEKPAITSVSVGLPCAGDISESVSIHDVYGLDMKSSDVVGLIGSPVNISVSAEFETAEIIFTYDENKLNDTPEENLCVMWYDSENDNYVLLEDSIVDTQNNTVSYTTDHFSRYLVVDREIWYDVWREDINYRTSGDVTYYDVALVVDTSGSMAGARLELAKTALNTFVEAMMSGDRGSIVKFDSYATTVYGLTLDKAILASKISSLTAGGGTNANNGIISGINQLTSTKAPQKRMMVLICDGDVNFVESTIQKAIDNEITIHCINVASSSSSAMKVIADMTGGMYYYAATSQDIISALSELQGDTIDYIDMTDSDGDGLYDVYETNGLRISNGQVVYTNPSSRDTDGDGISDYDAVGGLPVVETYLFNGDTYACTLNHAVVYGGLPTGFIYVDGTLNKDGTINNEKMNYVPYSYAFKHETYIEDKKLKFDDEDWGSRDIKGTNGVHGNFSDKLNEKNILDFVGYSTLNALTKILIFELEQAEKRFSINGNDIGKYNYPAIECFDLYTKGTGGDAEGLMPNGTRKYLESKFVTNEKLFNLNSGNVWFEKNMSEVVTVAESVLNEYNTEMYISLSPDIKWTGCNYNETNKVFTMDNITSLLNVSAFGIYNRAQAGVTAHCTYNPDINIYTIEYKYYIIDFYDFTLYEYLDKVNALGLARAYELYGTVSGKMIWHKDLDFILYHNK